MTPASSFLSCTFNFSFSYWIILTNMLVLKIPLSAPISSPIFHSIL
jgi:hypothetical protein